MNENNHDGEKLTNQGLRKQFDKCPGCGSSEQFFEGILKELKGRGLIDQKCACFDFQLQQGFPLSQQKMAILPFGSEIPHFKRIWDTCCSCGLNYATHLERTVVKKSLTPPQPAVFNRADRRRLGIDAEHGRGIPPRFNNPLLS